MIATEEVSQGVGVLGRKYGIASLPEIEPDRFEIAARKKSEALDARRVRLIQVAMDGAGILVSAFRNINALGGEVELSGAQATLVLRKLEEAREALDALISKIKNNGLLRAARGGVA